MTLVQITRDYTTTLNGVTHNFKAGEKYEAFVPLGGNYVDVKKISTVGGVSGKDVGITVLARVPNGYWQYTASMVEPTPNSQIQGVQNTSKQDTSIKYIVLGIVAIGLISFALTHKNK
jgi:hypothetical protein